MKEYGFQTAVQIIGDLQTEIKTAINRDGLQDLTVFQWINALRQEMLSLGMDMKEYSCNPGQPVTLRAVYNDAIRAMAMCARIAEMYLVADYEKTKLDEVFNPEFETLPEHTVVTTKGDDPIAYQD